MRVPFETVDVFTRTQFSGNPLAVFLQGEDLSSSQMQAIAIELDLSETTFVLPPSSPSATATVRIFTPGGELPFAGHPMLGTAFVLARRGLAVGPELLLEVPAGRVRVHLDMTETGTAAGARISAPQPLHLGEVIPAAVVAECVGLEADDIIMSPHPPIRASVGNPFVIARVTLRGLQKCRPNHEAFLRAEAAHGGPFALHTYAIDGDLIRARMFAPLSGTIEDPATGSANLPLGGLLLHLGDSTEAEFDILQGVEMGRPSELRVEAQRSPDGIQTHVSGHCVPVLEGFLNLAE